jgi:hypothetical protein
MRLIVLSIGILLDHVIFCPLHSSAVSVFALSDVCDDGMSKLSQIVDSGCKAFAAVEVSRLVIGDSAVLLQVK